MVILKNHLAILGVLATLMTLATLVFAPLLAAFLQNQVFISIDL